jgi:hypothetical protein
MRVLGPIVSAVFLLSCSGGDPERIEGTETGDCEDGADNDADGVFDCDDDGCSGAPACEADTDTDTDSDSDTDSDTDADSDTDTDTDTDTDSDTDTDTDVDYTVCNDGIAPYTDIQDAIDDANDGDVITVCAGTYEPIVVNDNDLTITGADGADVTSIAGVAQTAVEVGGFVELDLSGFTMYGESTTGPTAMHVKDADVILHDARFADNYNGTVAYIESGTVTMDHVLVEDNSFSGGATLIAAQPAATLEIQHSIFRNNSNMSEVIRLHNGTLNNNLIVNNTVSGFYGVMLIGDYGGSRVMVNNTIYGISGPYMNYAVYLSSGGNTVKNNIVAETDSGSNTISYYGATPDASYNDLWNNTPDNTVPGTGTGNLQLDPEFTNAAAGDFTLKSSSALLNRGDPDTDYNDVDGSRNEMGAYGGPGGAW